MLRHLGDGDQDRRLAGLEVDDSDDEVGVLAGGASGDGGEEILELRLEVGRI